MLDAGRCRPRSAWAVTVTATAVSTYALDGVATAAGVLLVASGALGGLGYSHALVFLAATYAAWGVGLRANLLANWSLLEQTGMSTNALSKAAHDLTRLRRTSVRQRWIASAVGYLGLELAKEAPYYDGAFGAAALSDAVSSTDAIVFLAGTNLGAAGYEYALARLTRLVLRRRPRKRARPSRAIRCRAKTAPSTQARSSPTLSPVLRIPGDRGSTTGDRPNQNQVSPASGQPPALAGSPLRPPHRAFRQAVLRSIPR